MLASFFEHRKKTQKTPFTHASNWTPKLIQLPPSVRKLIRANTYAFKTLNWRNETKQNIKKEEIQALSELIKNKEIVIKPADKGSSVVIMDREQYIWEAKRQLSNAEHYKSLNQPIFPETIPMIKSIIDDLYTKKFINNKQKLYLHDSIGSRPRLFYLLPKIHKNPNSWSLPFVIPPGRPIVSDCSSDTYRLAEYIEYYLNPISNKHPSYIKDTYDFLDKVRQAKIPENSLLFTVDIDSLYTNIDIEAGLKAVKNCFKKYPDKTRPDEQLLQLLEINLKRNDFEFDGKYYLQVKGTAMGKRFAPSYANIYMAEWEETALAACPIKPFKYFRFLDDIWGIWVDTKETFEDFMTLLNTHHTSIKIKYTKDMTSTNFLDTTTFKGPDFHKTGTLDTKVFFKETDTHQLLHRTSFHPQHTFRGLLKSQLIRFNRICSRQEDFCEAKDILFEALRSRGYSRSLLRESLRTFQEKKPREDSTLLPLVTSYLTPNTSLHHKVKDNYSIHISKTETLKKHKVISAYRKHKNLGDLLVHSKLKTLTPAKKSNICPEYKALKFVQSKKIKKVFQVDPRLGPNSKNCVYLIFCKICGLQYVGETRNTIATRMNQHRYNFSKQKHLNRHINNHFNTHGQNAVAITALQSNTSWNWATRKKKETEWINKLNTKYPGGLNEIN